MKSFYLYIYELLNNHHIILLNQKFTLEKYINYIFDIFIKNINIILFNE